jgi:hypothetical protein
MGYSLGMDSMLLNSFLLKIDIFELKVEKMNGLKENHENIFFLHLFLH